MRKILKYSLDFLDRQVVELPVGAAILSIQMQDGQLQLWALVDRAQQSVGPRTLRIIETGRLIEDEEFVRFNYITTMQQSLGGMIFVWHIFEEEAANGA